MNPFRRTLFPHQREAVQWMERCESGAIDGVPGGGILADEMGLGKTTSAIAQIHHALKTDPEGQTLIVVPKAVLTQWIQEIHACLGAEFPVFNFTGVRRFRDKHPITPFQLRDYPIVISTHHQIQWTKRSKWRYHGHPLHGIRWRRVILDEAHVMKRGSTVVGSAIHRMDRRYFWALTGTPTPNRPAEIKNLLEECGRPTNIVMKGVYARIPEYVSQFILRRRVANYPKLLATKCQIQTHLVPFATEREREFTRRVEGEIRTQLAEMMHTRFNFGSILALIIRLRQASVHPQIVIDAEKKARVLRREVPGALHVDPDLEHDPEDFVSPSSKMLHVAQQIKIQRETMAVVFCHFRQEMNMIAKSLSVQGYDVSQIHGGVPSAKRSQLIQRASNIGDPRNQNAIRDIVKRLCFHDGITRYIMSFLVQKQVLLIQMQAGSEGLNIQGCNRVYFSSSDWTPGTEDQATARCFRIGQTRDVKVIRVVSVDRVGIGGAQEVQQEDVDQHTIEARMTQRTNEKRALLAQFWDDPTFEMQDEVIDKVLA